MSSYIKKFFYHLRILPVLVVVASLAFVVRLGDAYISVKSLSGSAFAEEAKAEEKKPEEAKPEAKPEEKPEEKKDATSVATPAAEQPPESDLKSKDEKPEPNPSSALNPESADKKWQDASDEDANSDIKKELYQDLSKRRAEIEEREKKLSEREALLEAAKKELDRKYQEMEGVRDEIKGLLKQQSAEEAARIQSLVKIYSGMKPKDAARIFDTLDTDILMDVVGSMPESKASPIIALMDADRAKALTTLLAEQKKLPDVP